MDLAQCGEEITCNDHQGAVPDCGEKEEWFRAFGDAWKNCGRRGIRCRNTTNNQRKVTHCLGMTTSSTLSCRAHLLAMIIGNGMQRCRGLLESCCFDKLRILSTYSGPSTPYLDILGKMYLGCTEPLSSSYILDIAMWIHCPPGRDLPVCLDATACRLQINIPPAASH